MTGPAPARVLIANPGADLYGSDRMVLATICALVDAGHPVTLTTPGTGPLLELARERGAEVVIQPTPIIRKSAMRPAGLLRLIADTLRAVPASIALLRRERPAAVLVNTITPPLWFLLARLLGIPVLCHVHEGEASASRPVRIALALPLLLCRRLIVNSRFSLGVLTSAIPRLAARAVVVYNAVAGPAQLQPPRERLDPPVRLLYVGRLSGRKGPDVAVRAVAELRDRGEDVTLELLGAVFGGYEWFERQMRSDVAELGLVDRVQFSGFHPDRWPATAAADIVLVPSTVDEPFGNVAVEAALAARPQVVSGLSGLLEASEGIGSAVQVPASSATDIADAVQQIVADWPRYRAAALQDATTAAERYSQRQYASELLAVVDSAILAPAPGRF